VLAQSEIDGQCRRARVKAIISEDKVLILCIDVGNYEVVSQKGLYLLSLHLRQVIEKLNFMICKSCDILCLDPC
jgi:Tudor domain